MTRSIIILTTPRSGSSALAGALHTMGVNMGAGFFQPTDQFNPKGYFEDKRWRRISNALTGHRYAVRQPTALPPVYRTQYLSAISRSCSNQVWGVKDTRLVFLFPLVRPLIEERADMRVLVARRDYDQVIDSLHNHSLNAYGGRFKKTKEEIEYLVDVWTTALNDCVDGLEKDQYKEVNYSDLIDDPVKVLGKLREFCFDGYKKYATDPEVAAKFIDAELNHNETDNDDSE